MLFKRLFGIKRSYNVIEKVLGRHAELGWTEIPLTGLILPYVCAYPKLGPGTFYYVYTFWSRYQELGLISSFDQIILWQESCNSDEQQFYQCQENKQLTTSHHNKKTTTWRWNSRYWLGPGKTCYWIKLVNGTPPFPSW